MSLLFQFHDGIIQYLLAGEFMATRSQDEVFRGEIKLEKVHIANYKADELLELRDMLSRIGIDVEKCPALQRKVIDYYTNNDEALLKAMVALEFGCIDKERRLAWKASAYSFFCFITGSLPSIIPFACTTNSLTGLLISGLATAIGLLTVGVVKTWATRGNCIRSAVENLFVAVAGGAAAYGIGTGFEKLTGAPPSI
jgi:VIT1/CCC1 family predicted Fe2+/Mn2+ transporter